MMKILILNGSPRANGNTKALTAAFAKGAQSVGHEVVEYQVGRMDINACLACEYCHGKGDGACIQKDEMQTIEGITIYPNEYFNPFDDITGLLRKTPNTRSIHWYAKTWADNNHPWMVGMKRWIRRTLGTGTTNFMKGLLKS